MWLLDVETQELKFFHDSESSENRYAILSHTWEGEEVTFHDVQDLDKARLKRGFQKVDYLCSQALKDELKYAWIDTCCIDKSSSAELSEAINSMYKWYRNASVCYAYLSDVYVEKNMFTHRSLGHLTSTTTHVSWAALLEPKLYQALQYSRWFTRGWTLQEMIAPPRIEFFGSDWTFIGTNYSLAEILESITKVPVGGIHPDSLGHVCAASKLSWAARRRTTRPEDRAYSLLGIFNVNMPLLYGEGETKAFERLQIAILRSTRDLSLLLWDRSSRSTDIGIGTFVHLSVLAHSLDSFESGGNIVPYSLYGMDPRAPFEVIEGPLTQLRVAVATVVQDESTSYQGYEDTLFAVVNYRYRDKPTRPLAIPLRYDSEAGDLDAETELIGTIGWNTNFTGYILPLPTTLERMIKRRLLLTAPIESSSSWRPNNDEPVPKLLRFDQWCWETFEVKINESVWQEYVRGYKTRNNLFDAKETCLADRTDPRDFTFTHGNDYVHILFRTSVPTGFNRVDFCHITLSDESIDRNQRCFIDEDEWIWLPKVLAGDPFLIESIDLGHKILDFVLEGTYDMLIQVRETTLAKMPEILSK